MSEDRDRFIWRASRRCATGACVEVAQTIDGVHLRSSQEREGPQLSISRAAWASFLERIRSGEFDRP